MKSDDAIVAGSTLRRYRRAMAVLLFLAILFAVFEFSGVRDNLDLAFIRDSILHHPIGGLALFVALFALGNLIQIPGWIFLAAAVLTLGKTWGGVVTYVAALASCALTFLVVRVVGGDALRLIENRTAKRLLDRLDAHPVSSVALLRTLFQTAPALNYSLAMSGIAFPFYMAGTAIGLPLPIALYCVFFDALGTQLHIPHSA